jgi:uncharacterized protein YqeY
MFKLEEQIEQKFKEAMLAKDGLKVSNYRLLKAAIHNERIRQGQAFSEPDLIKVLRRELKKRHEAAAGFAQGNRPELSAKEKTEAELIKELLPQELGEAQIRAVINEALKRGNFSDQQNFGLVMKEVMVRLQDQADGRLVSRLVKEQLAAQKPGLV